MPRNSFRLSDRPARNIGARDLCFIDGRRADIIVSGKKVGVFGEIHPAVRAAFELEHPVAAFELDLRAVSGYPASKDTLLRLGQ